MRVDLDLSYCTSLGTRTQKLASPRSRSCLSWRRITCQAAFASQLRANDCRYELTLLFDIAVQYLRQILRCLHFTRIGFGVLGENVKPKFSFDDLGKQAAHRPTAGGNLLEYVRTLLLLLNRLLDALQLALNTVHSNEELLLLLHSMCHRITPLLYCTQYSTSRTSGTNSPLKPGI